MSSSPKTKTPEQQTKPVSPNAPVIDRKKERIDDPSKAVKKLDFSHIQIERS